MQHILPQTPDESSKWKQKWSEKDMEWYRHDISNIVLTRNNSNYSNSEFENMEKGNSGVGYCYANSDIRQERKIAEFDDWTVENCKKRRESLIAWIISRWGIDKHFEIPKDIEDEEEVETME